jgi:hypothetical protein
MKNEITKRETPEEHELRKKLDEFSQLEKELIQRELDLATLQAELHFFETKYNRIVGVCYAELDDIDAQIAEVEAQLNPEDNNIKEKATQSRTQARESAQAAGISQGLKEEKFKPSERLKKLYREIAKRIHPDLATDEKTHLHREKLMADANRAYEEGDEDKLMAVLAEWESSPESVEGEGTASELVRVIRKLSQVKKRLQTIEMDIAKLVKSELYQLKTKVIGDENKGRDLLTEMASQLKEQIVTAKQRLSKIKKE